jgi:hypothetical protein
VRLTLTTRSEGIFLVDADEAISSRLLGGMGHEPDVAAVLQERAQANMVAIDVGAHIGWFSVQLAKHYLRVLAFEPQRPLFPQLRANLLLNKAWHVEPFRMALYDRPCSLRVGSPEAQHVPLPLVPGGGPDYDRLKAPGSLCCVPADSGGVGDDVDAQPLDSFLPGTCGGGGIQE